MGAMNSASIACAASVVQRALILEQLDRRDLITVTGPNGLGAMISLCQAGFEHVECTRQSICECADGASDALMLIGPMTEDVLLDVLRHTIRLLRDGGRLIIQLSATSHLQAAIATLAGLGFHAAFAVVDHSVGAVGYLTVSHKAPAVGRWRPHHTGDLVGHL